MPMRARWPPENWCGKRRRNDGIEPDLAHQLIDVVVDVVAGVDAVHARRLADDLGHAHARIERRERILEHHLDLERGVAARIRRKRGDIGAAPRARAQRRRQDARRDASEGRFAAAGFAGEADHFALGDGQAHVVERMHHDFVHVGAGEAGDSRGEIERPREILGDVLEFEQRGHRAAAVASMG